MMKLTKKESEIMDIIWKENVPLTAAEIQEQDTDMSIYSVQQVLLRLLSMEFLKLQESNKIKKHMPDSLLLTLVNLNTFLHSLTIKKQTSISN